MMVFVGTIQAGKAQTNFLTNTGSLPEHPRLLLLKGEEGNIRGAMANNKDLAGLHKQILQACDHLRDIPPVQHIKLGRRLLDQSREALRRIFYLSYAWRITHEQRYLERGEQELLAIAAFSDWNPDHFLDVAEMTMAVSIGYDWLYEGLSPNSRTLIRDAILHKGLEPSMDVHYNGWIKGTNNWNQVCNTGISYGALAIWEDQPELAKNIVNRAIGSIQLPMADYSPDGAYPEGYAYWGYGTNFTVMFLGAVEKLFHQDFGLEQLPGFLATAAYLENMTGPSGNGFNFSDSGLISELQPDPAMFWFAGRLKDPSLLWVERPRLSLTNMPENIKNRLLPGVMVWAAATDLAGVKAPEQLMWAGGGKTPVAMMRSSWTDPNAVYVAVKGGSPANSHAHLDVGSFVMESDGVRWAMDFGAENYTAMEAQGIDLFNSKPNSPRWQVFRYKNQAHNTLSLNDQIQTVDGYAPFSSFSKDPKWMNAITDLTGVYQGQVNKARRGVALINKNIVAVRDELEALPQETTIRWNMLTPAKVKILNDREAELTKDGKKLLLKVQAPIGVKLQTWSTEPPTSYESKNNGTTFVGFNLKAPVGSAITLTVLFIPEKIIGSDLPQIGPLKDWPQ